MKLKQAMWEAAGPIGTLLGIGVWMAGAISLWFAACFAATAVGLGTFGAAVGCVAVTLFWAWASFVVLALLDQKDPNE